MNRLIIRILLATAAAAVAACVTEDRERHDPIVQLAFDPVMHARVRSAETAGMKMGQTDGTSMQKASDSDPAAMTFGVSAWQLPEEESWETDRLSAMPLLDAARLVRDGELWRPETGGEWPANGYTITCIGFAPHDAASDCNAVDGVCFKEVDTSADPGDLRYTQPQADLVKYHNGGAVTLPLLKALCEVDVRIRGVNGYEDTEVYIRSITLVDAAIRGDFHSLPVPTWTKHGDNAPLTIFEGEMRLGSVPQNAGSTRRLIPQGLNSAISVEYDFLTPDGTRVRQTDTTAPVVRELEAGHHYTFTLAVSPAGAEVIPELPDQSTQSEAKP